MHMTYLAMELMKIALLVHLKEQMLTLMDSRLKEDCAEALTVMTAMLQLILEQHKLVHAQEQALTAPGHNQEHARQAENIQNGASAITLQAMETAAMISMPAQAIIPARAEHALEQKLYARLQEHAMTQQELSGQEHVIHSQDAQA